MMRPAFLGRSLRRPLAGIAQRVRLGQDHERRDAVTDLARGSRHDPLEGQQVVGQGPDLRHAITCMITSGLCSITLLIVSSTTSSAGPPPGLVLSKSPLESMRFHEFFPSLNRTWYVSLWGVCGLTSPTSATFLPHRALMSDDFPCPLRPRRKMTGGRTLEHEPPQFVDGFPHDLGLRPIPDRPRRLLFGSSTSQSFSMSSRNLRALSRSIMAVMRLLGERRMDETDGRRWSLLPPSDSPLRAAHPPCGTHLKHGCVLGPYGIRLLRSPRGRSHSLSRPCVDAMRFLV